MTKLKVLVLLMALFTTQIANSRELIRELEDEADVVGTGTCDVGEKLPCVKLTHKGNTYMVIGKISGDDFFALYIVQQVGDEWKLVWSWKGSV